MQTAKVEPVPIILYDTKFWAGLVDWMKTTLAVNYKTISPGDPDLFHLVDSPEEVVRVIDEFYSKSLLRPNF